MLSMGGAVCVLGGCLIGGGGALTALVTLCQTLCAHQEQAPLYCYAPETLSGCSSFATKQRRSQVCSPKAQDPQRCGPGRGWQHAPFKRLTGCVHL